MTSISTQRERVAVIPLELTYLRDECGTTRRLTYPRSRTGNMDIPALCAFLSTGMFLGTDTYFSDLTTARPGEDLEVDADGILAGRKQRFSWATGASLQDDRGQDAYLDQLDGLLEPDTNQLENGVVVALSGGLDSRSLAAALHGESLAVRSYSYAFDRGLNELKYGREISRLCGFDHTDFVIPNGYLWDEIDRFPELTHCYAEFTHPRQMAVIDRLSAMGDTLFLGHWGDVLFDDFALAADAEPSVIADLAFQRLCKSSGLNLADELWREHGLDGRFADYLRKRLTGQVDEIKIDDANARMRAFKSLYWAPRWTSVNLAVFKAAGRLVVPYYSDEMCAFVRSVPLKYLEARHLQIEYIKRKSPALADVPWQAWAPFNLHTWRAMSGLPGLPVRAVGRATRVARQLLRRPRVRQNWQNQFLGAENEKHLSRWLLETPELDDVIPRRMVSDRLAAFLGDPTEHWHAVSMLLTLAVFAKNKHRWIEGDK